MSSSGKELVAPHNGTYMMLVKRLPSEHRRAPDGEFRQCPSFE
jgi:hypothetical protein